jgi:hypothetical protein
VAALSNRWIRFALAVVALAAAGAAAYRVIEHERRVAQETAATRATEFAIETALATAADLRASLHAYVAPGQGHAFWTARAGMLLDKLRASVLAVDAAVVASGASVGESLDVVDRLGAAEARARERVQEGQSLLAGEVIFTEARDLLDALSIQVARARDQIAVSSGTRQAAARQEQTWLLGGAAGILAFVMLLLVPPGRAPVAAAEPVTFNVAPMPAAPAVAAPAPDLFVQPDMTEAARICTDIARVSDSTEIAALLTRAAKVLDSSGMIVWIASADGSELYPVASAGYDERMLARIGSIPRDASNLTAAAFRDAATRTAAAVGASPAALAVPLVAPQGAVGVLSAEIRLSDNVDPARLALATILGAQLATLLGSLPSAAEPAAAPQAQVN